MQLSKFNFSSSHMVSFDVVSLFTNIPLDLVIDIVLQKIYSTLQLLWHFFFVHNVEM